MYRYGVQNMYDDDEILQNILLKESKPNTNSYTNLKSIHIFLSQHAMKILQYVTKNHLKRFKHFIYDMAC
jgi:hypothetical protein